MAGSAELKNKVVAAQAEVPSTLDADAWSETGAPTSFTVSRLTGFMFEVDKQ